MTLPLLVSVPHAGLEVPEAVRSLCRLTPDEIAADGDLGAREIYAIKEHVGAFVTTDVARAIVDMNRATDDFRRDGVIKTHTCWDVPIYATAPEPRIVRRLLEDHHAPYHARLAALARSGVKLGVDCHTMAVHGPPVGPDPGVRRPDVCLGYADGTCPRLWIETLASFFREVFEGEVTINRPFAGGYITRTHAAELPWLQIELARTEEPNDAEKKRRVLEGLTRLCAEIC